LTDGPEPDLHLSANNEKPGLPGIPP